MALFGRRRAGLVPDETFRFLTVEQAARFRGLIRTAFADAGLEVTAYADHLVDDRGRVFGLGNVAAACHNDERGESAWPEVTRAHALRIVRAMGEPSPFDVLSAEEIYAATFVRLMPAGDMAPFKVAYAQEVTRGVVEVLNVDLPETVALFQDEHVERFGPYADLRRAGLANLRKVNFEKHDRLEHNGGRIDVLIDESMFVGSTLRIVDDVVGRFEPLPPAGDGVFAAAPFRHQLAFHVLRDATAVPSLQMLAMFAKVGFDDSAGPLSPDVYWSHRGDLIPLTVHDSDGTRIDVGPELGDVLNRLCAG